MAFAISCLFRLGEGVGHDVAQFRDVAHVNATRSRVDRESPTHGSVLLLLRSEYAHKVLVEKWCDDERMIRKSGFLHDPIDFSLAGKVGYVELATADRFDIRQR
jgi:hypothetical protein